MNASEWKTVRIRDLGYVVTGRTPPLGKNEYFGRFVPFLTPTDMNGQRTIDQFSRHLSEVGAKAFSRIVVPQGVAVSCIGSQMGKCALIKQPTVTNQQVNTIVPNERIVDLLYLYYAMVLRRGEILQLGGSGSGIPILNKSSFEQLSFTLPSLEEQRAIAVVLGVLDDKIELNRHMNATLEAMARALFRSWFVDFDPVRAKMEGRKPYGMDASTAALFPAALDDSPLGPIPHGWRVGTVGDIATTRREGVQPSAMQPDTRYIGLEHMPRGSIALTEFGQVEDVTSTKLRFEAWDILFGKLRPYFKKVGVPGFSGVCSSDIAVVQPKQRYDFGLLLCHLAGQEFVDYTERVSNGAKMPRVGWADMARYEIVLAPAPILEGFDKQIRPLVQMIHANGEQSRTLATLRDALLPQLLSGAVRVGDAARAAGVAV